MKPFDLEAAKRGEPICHMAMPVRFVAHVPDAKEFERVVCVTPEGAILLASEKGKYDAMTSLRLMMAPPKRRTAWLVMRHANISCKALASKEDADIFLDAQTGYGWHGPYAVEVLDK